MHGVLVNRCLSLPRKSVVRLTDRLDRTITVDWDVKTKQTNLCMLVKNACFFSFEISSFKQFFHHQTIWIQNKLCLLPGSKLTAKVISRQQAGECLCYPNHSDLSLHYMYLPLHYYLLSVTSHTNCIVAH